MARHLSRRGATTSARVAPAGPSKLILHAPPSAAPNQTTRVYVSYAPADKNAVSRIVDALRRAGLDVALDTELAPGEDFREALMRQLEAADGFVVVWSAQAASSKFVGSEIEAAIKAWSAQRLVLAVLDGTPLPLGLRDIPVFPVGSDADLARLVGRVEEVAPRPGAGAQPVPPLVGITDQLQQLLASSVTQLPSPAMAEPRGPARFWQELRRHPGAMAFGFAAAIVLDLCVDLRGAFFALLARAGAALGPAWLPYALAAAAGAIGVIAGLALGRAGRPRPAAPQSPAFSFVPELPPLPQRHVFISYSLKDTAPVDRVRALIEQLGHSVWIDRTKEGSRRYAGPIVEAIRQSRLIALMGSRHAFESDHVVREIYVAGDCKKPFVVFDLDASEQPDEVRYFLSGFPRVLVDDPPDEVRLSAEIERAFGGGAASS